MQPVKSVNYASGVNENIRDVPDGRQFRGTQNNVVPVPTPRPFIAGAPQIDRTRIQNGLIFASGEIERLKVFRRFRNSRGNCDVVVLMAPATHRQLGEKKDKRVFLLFSAHPYKNRVQTLRCFKCFGYEHTDAKGSCKNSRVCGRCGEKDHVAAKCTSRAKCMLIKGHMDRSKMPRVLCAGERIECVRQYKYLGVILDSVPNFVEHAKCVRAKVSTYMFSRKAHVGRGWGIQRRVVETLYDTVCIPMIAYGGEERTKSMTKSHVRRHLNALHRVLLLTLTRGCTLASTVSLEVVAGRMPLDLAVCLRRLRQSIKAKWAIKLLGFTSDAEAPVADEMGRANEHVLSLWQERWDAEER